MIDHEVLLAQRDALRDALKKVLAARDAEVKAQSAAREAGDGIHSDMVDDLKGQLLTAFLSLLGGQLAIPVKEVDETGRFVLVLSVSDGNFNFELKEKRK